MFLISNGAMWDMLVFPFQVYFLHTYKADLEYAPQQGLTQLTVLLDKVCPVDRRSALVSICTAAAKEYWRNIHLSYKQISYNSCKKRNIVLM